MPLLASYTAYDYRNYNASIPSSAGVPVQGGPGAYQPTALPYGVASGGLVNVQAVYLLTTANLLGLPATKIQLVAAPGTNYALVVDVMTLQYKFGGTAFTIGNANNAFSVEYTGKAVNLISFNATGLVDQAANTIGTTWPAVAGQDIAQTNEANLGLELTLTGTTPALTLGNGSVVLTLQYELLVLQ